MNNGLQDVNQEIDETAIISLTAWRNLVTNAMFREYLDNADIGKGPIMSANEKQIGGHHYRSSSRNGEQHWDRIYRLYGRGYFVGCATKYIERYHLKNGKQDLEKAIHFLEKLIELEYGSEAEVGAAKGVLGFEPTSDEYLTEKMKWANNYNQNATGIPDHLKECEETERQREVAAKFDDLRDKHMNAISPMLQKVMQDKEWKIDFSEPQAQGYVNQDGKMNMSTQHYKPEIFGTVTNDSKTV